MNISFIGFGNMAKAMASRLQQDKSHYLRAASPSLPTGTNQEGIDTFSDNTAILPDCDVLILAVKPKDMSAVLPPIQPHIPKQCLVISIASGLTLPWFSHILPRTPIVRAMPNIAAIVGESATPLFANTAVSDQQKKIAEQVFLSIGLITWATQESDIDAYTALSGSGPAYVFLFIEAMTKAAIHLGLTETIAESFALQTLQGAVTLAQNMPLSPKELRARVTSPGGTTAAAIQVFTEHGFESLIQTAMKAAYDRAQVLGQQLP